MPKRGPISFRFGYLDSRKITPFHLLFILKENHLKSIFDDGDIFIFDVGQLFTELLKQFFDFQVFFLDFLLEILHEIMIRLVDLVKQVAQVYEYPRYNQIQQFYKISL